MIEAAATSRAAAARARRGADTMTAIVLRRSDFRESSRIVTCLTREHGRVAALAKGAHRPDSAFVGRIDFLNEVRATFSSDRSGLRLLLRVEQALERRTLREPRRFLAGSHLATLCEFAMPDSTPQPAVFDLLQGGLNLLARCPAPAIGHVVLGLELRHLELLGALPDLDRCAAGGESLANGAFQQPDGPGLVCRRCAGAKRSAVPRRALDLLRMLRATPGRLWPDVVAPVPARVAAPWPGQWLLAATELQSRLRPLLFRLC
jgi:DNA repair protein RecO (recombination protein O)